MRLLYCIHFKRWSSSLLVSLGKIRLSSGPCPSRNLGETHLQTQFRSRLFNSGTLGKSGCSPNVWNKDSILVLIPCTVVRPRSARSVLCPNAPLCQPSGVDVLCPIPGPHALRWVSVLSLHFPEYIPTACSSPYT
ncbi:hypothetical protein mRhiFer1_009995 [Rhinolophus ferrumequinum]|uniref:Uncharacterized protein n=1 Tax=Rhinolophus ferrumequinum TaxID=59479 RepID=A0A7J7Y5G5_RHIFE|nr:hypothetical protein mRhiFer1_009995 [Rhinolophus ferrumequinum]